MSLELTKILQIVTALVIGIVAVVLMPLLWHLPEIMESERPLETALEITQENFQPVQEAVEIVTEEYEDTAEGENVTASSATPEATTSTAGNPVTLLASSLDSAYDSEPGVTRTVNIDDGDLVFQPRGNNILFVDLLDDDTHFIVRDNLVPVLSIDTDKTIVTHYGSTLDVQGSIKIGGTELVATAEQLNTLTAGTESDASELHQHDERYYTEDELGTTSEGSEGARKIGTRAASFTNFSPSRDDVEAALAAIDAALSSGGGGATTFTVTGDAGSSQTISDGDTLTITTGAGLTATASATDTVTIAIDTDGITEGFLKVVDSPADEECLTYESTGGDFEWESCGSGSGMTSFTLAGTSGSSQTIEDGETLTIAAGTGITTTGGATDTVTVAATLGTSITGSEVDDDTLDFVDFEDTLNLDAALFIQQGTNSTIFNYSGTNSEAVTISASALTTASALQVTAFNTATVDQVVDQILFDLRNRQSTTANSEFIGLNVAFMNDPSVAGNTEYAVRIKNQDTNNTTDNAVAALLHLDNADRPGDGSTVVSNAILIENSGDISGGITNAINLDDTDITNDIVLQNDEVIHNNTDGTIAFTDGTNTLFSIADQGTTGNATVSGDLTISGDDLVMATNTSGHLLVADGTNFNPVALSGDATLSSAGALTIASDAIEESMLKAVDTASDEECLTYETTTGDFEWQSCGSGSGMTSFTLSDGTNTQTIEDGNTLTLTPGSDIDVTVSATDTATIALESTIDTVATINLSGTGTLNGLDAIDATTEATLESTLDIAGDVTGTGLGSVAISADVIDFAEMEDTLDLDAATDINLGANLFSVDLDSTGDFAIRDGTTNVVLFEDNSTVDVTFPAAGLLTIDASATANTTTAGVLDINVNSITANNVGLNIDYIANNGTTAANDLFAGKINITANDADADLFGLQIASVASANASANSFECLLCLTNAENTAGTVIDAIRISDTSATSGAIATAIDINSANVTTDIELQNDEVIHNNTDGTIAFTDGTNTLMTVVTNGTDGDVTITGDLTVTGDDLAMTTNTDAYILVADGSNFSPVAMSGDITIDNAGTTAIGDDKVTEADLKAIDAATDEECLTYETTTGDFEWEPCSGAGSSTLQDAYDADVDDGDTTITLSTADDSMIISNPASSGTDSVFAFMVDQNDITNNQLAVEIENDGSGNGLLIDQNGDGVALNIDTAATSASTIVVTTASQTGNILDVTASSLTSGGIARFYSDSADTTARSLVDIINDNASATGVIGLRVQQDSTGNLASFFDEGTEVITMTDDGRLGLGAPDPAALLRLERDISGTPGAGGAFFSANGSTFTDSDTAASGTAALMAFHSMAAPTLAADNLDVTTTDAATFYIAGAPAVGSNQTITRSYALLVDGDDVRFDDDVIIGGNTSPTETISNATFELNGDDLFVAGDLGVEGIIYGEQGDFTVPDSEGVVGITIDQNDSTNNPAALYIGNAGTGDGITITSDQDDQASYYFMKMISDVDTGNDTEFSFDQAGTALADGAFTGGGADLAEYFATDQRGLVPGTIISIDTSKPKNVRAATAGIGPLIGVVSTKPGLVANGGGAELDRARDPNFTLVGLVGQIPTRVSSENGPIAVGDGITVSSVAGVGRKANPGEQIVGVAMTEFTGAGAGIIETYVGHQSLASTTTFQHVTQQVKAVADAVAGLSSDVQQAMVAGATTSVAPTPTPTSSLAELTAGDLTFGGALTAENNVDIMGALSVRADVTLYASLLAETVRIAQALTVQGDANVLGNLSVGGDVAIAGRLSVSNQQAGLAQVPRGGREVVVRYPQAYAVQPVVQVTSHDSSVTYRLTKQSTQGFTIVLADLAAQDVTFSWFTLPVEAPTTARGTTIDTDGDGILDVDESETAGETEPQVPEASSTPTPETTPSPTPTPVASPTPLLSPSPIPSIEL